jgi:hypothetical protein
VAGLTLALILVLELALRAAFALKDAIRPLPEPDRRVVAEGYAGAPWVPALYREQGEVQSDWWPYVTHRARPSTGHHVSIDEQGLRRTIQAETIPPDAPVVWLVGGSVAWGMGARDRSTIASRLAAELAALGRPTRVVNRAQIGYVNTQEVADLLLALRDGARPDVVVFLDGVNDVLAAYQNGRAGWPQNEANRVAEFNLRQSPPRLAAALLGALTRESAFARLAASAGARLRGGGIAPPRGRIAWTDALAGEVSETYAANLALVDHLAREHDFRVLVAWQPVLFGKSAMTGYEREKATQYDWLRRPLADGMQRLARIETPGDRVRVLDLTGAFDADPSLVFVDFCHVTEAGHAAIARALAKAVHGWLTSTDPVEPARGDSGPP